MSILEVWGAEYQENNAILVAKKDLEIVQKFGYRENCLVSPVGFIYLFIFFINL
jgi:phosphoribosylformylglycinamidine synthase